MEIFENGDVKSITCYRFQSKLEHLSIMAEWQMSNPRSQLFSSFSSVLLWIGENDMKTLVWMKIFCFVFAGMKADTFENALV